MYLLSYLKIFIIPEAIIPAMLLGVVTATIIIFSLKVETNKKVAFAKEAIHQSDWWLVHGDMSKYYYDLDTELQPKYNNRLLSKWYINIIKKLQKELNVKKLVFVEKDAGPIGALSLKDLIFSRTGIPTVEVRTRRRVYCAAIKGKLQQGDNVIIVTDVVTTGGTVNKIAEILKFWNVNIVGVVAAFNRCNENSLKILGQEVDIVYAIDKNEVEELQAEKLLPCPEDAYPDSVSEECRLQ